MGCREAPSDQAEDQARSEQLENSQTTAHENGRGKARADCRCDRDDDCDCDCEHC